MKLPVILNGVVALDVSLTSTGYARIRMEDPLTTFVQAIQTDPKESRLQRHRTILQKVVAGVAKHDWVFIEDYAWGIMKGSSLVTLGELNGLLKYVLWQYSAEHREPIPVNISVIKKWAGAEKKDQMKLSVYKKWKQEFKTDDELDAFVLADLGWHLLGQKPLRKLWGWERDLIKKFQEKHGWER